jgi:hypothetical protein
VGDHFIGGKTFVLAGFHGELEGLRHTQ